MKKIFVSILACLLALSLCITALAAADGVLRPGDQGEKVKAAQRLLYQYGYYTGRIDGKYGKQTTNAVKAFQEFNGLEADGKIGPKTNAILTSGGAVPASQVAAPGENQTIAQATAAAIKQVQSLLKQYGYYGGSLTGTFNDATVNAIKAFQGYNGLKKTGALDEETLAKLNSGSVVKAPIKDKATANKDDVKHVQERLAYYGYYTLKIDGLYGAGTIAAVKNFQLANGLTADGTVGQDTLAKLDANDSVSKSLSKDKEELSKLPILRKGDKNASVKEAQRLLKNAGYYQGDIDGEYAGDIVDAVKAFQTANGLDVDGKVGPKTWAKLLNIDYDKVNPETSTPTPVPVDDGVLRYGDEGDDVKALQQKLNTLGYKLKVDGKFGDKTITSVRNFQANSKLTEDGKVGPETMAAIDKAVAKKAAEPKVVILRYGDKGAEVQAMQTKLAALGYEVNVDGTFGNKTWDVVRRFQNANKLTVDGKAGPQTLGLIDKLLAEKNAAAK